MSVTMNTNARPRMQKVDVKSAPTDEPDRKTEDGATSDHVLAQESTGEKLPLPKPSVRLPEGEESLAEHAEMSGAQRGAVRSVESINSDDRFGFVFSNFDDFDLDGDGLISKVELQTVVHGGGPQAETAQKLLDNFNAAILANIDPRVPAWAGISRHDFFALKGDMLSGGKSLEEAIWDRAMTVMQERGVTTPGMTEAEAREAVHAYVESCQDRLGVQDEAALSEYQETYAQASALVEKMTGGRLHEMAQTPEGRAELRAMLEALRSQTDSDVHRLAADLIVKGVADVLVGRTGAGLNMAHFTKGDFSSNADFTITGIGPNLEIEGEVSGVLSQPPYRTDYSFQFSYDEEGPRLSINVPVNFVSVPEQDPPITDEELAAMNNVVAEAWGDLSFRDGNGAVVDMEFTLSVAEPGDNARTVTLHRNDPSLRSNASNWNITGGVEAAGDMVAHEYGHCIGIQDEYVETPYDHDGHRLGADNRTGGDDDSIMGYGLTRASPEHAQGFMELVAGITGQASHAERVAEAMVADEMNGAGDGDGSFTVAELAAYLGISEQDAQLLSLKYAGTGLVDATAIEEMVEDGVLYGGKNFRLVSMDDVRFTHEEMELLAGGVKVGQLILNGGRTPLGADDVLRAVEEGIIVISSDGNGTTVRPGPVGQAALDFAAKLLTFSAGIPIEDPAQLRAAVASYYKHVLNRPAPNFTDDQLKEWARQANFVRDGKLDATELAAFLIEAGTAAPETVSWDYRDGVLGPLQQEGPDRSGELDES